MANLNKDHSRAKNASEETVSPIERALRNASDIVIVLDADERVESLSVNALSKSLGSLDHWRGEKISDLLTEESTVKLAKRLKAIHGSTEDTFDNIELNHIDGSHWEFPIRYMIQRMDDEGRVILVGRDLRSTAEVQQQLVRAQLALEKEYEKHRDFETRYRVLRDTVSNAALFVDAASGNILDINSLAANSLGGTVEELIGLPINSLLEEQQKRPALQHMLKLAADSDLDPMIAVSLRSKASLKIRPKLFRSAGDMMILCRLDASNSDAPVTDDLLNALNALYQQGADAMVFTDPQGVIRHANEGFLALCDVVQASDLKGKQIGDFLMRGGIDQKVLLDSTSQTGRLKTFSTKLKSAHGGEVDVEISAAHLKDAPDPYFGFVIRSRSQPESARESANRDDSMQSAMNLVGTAPLKELVAATADVVEKMCIETAVELTDNNRVAAAELLGLSRQSFYVRLRKYGLLKKDED